MQRYFRVILTFSLLLSLTACVTAPPERITNICSIFRQYPDWLWAAQDSSRRWGVPVSVEMAFIYQESRFRGDAKPPRTKLLWIIPWTRPSSSYGYTQALDSTWEHYKKDAGKHWVSRDNFADAIDFIGWYIHSTHRKLGIPRNDPYHLYLAYHEGNGGYARGSYKRKAWLMRVARKVTWRAKLYHSQLRACKASLKQKPWYRFW